MTKPSKSDGTDETLSGGKPEKSIARRPKEPAITVDFDPSALNSARAYWYFGKWEELSAIELTNYEQHPDRAKLALLKSAAHQQLGQLSEAEKCVRLAKEWGCDKRLISHVLVAGIHNVLGKAYALKRDDEKARNHFEAAINIGDNNNDRRLATQARTVQELTKLGLLPEATRILTETLESIKDLKQRPSQQQAQISILDTEVEILNHELSLAYQKNQLYLGKQNSSGNFQDKIDLERLRQLSPSQIGQDLWVLQKTNFKNNGYFVEFGATDGVLLSNTYLLEEEFGWTGICAEPNPKYFEQLKMNRACIVTDACIGGISSEKVTFILADEYGGIDGFSTEGLHKEKVNNYKRDNRTIELDTISLNDLLLAHSAPRTIDYISIDTEGNEYSILKSFPLSDWDIKIFSIEHNFENDRDKIRSLMEKNGYERYPLEWDDFYVKRE